MLACWLSACVMKTDKRNRPVACSNLLCPLCGVEDTPEIPMARTFINNADVDFQVFARPKWTGSI